MCAHIFNTNTPRTEVKIDDEQKIKEWALSKQLNWKWSAYFRWRKVLSRARARAHQWILVRSEKDFQSWQHKLFNIDTHTKKIMCWENACIYKKWILVTIFDFERLNWTLDRIWFMVCLIDRGEHCFYHRFTVIAINRMNDGWTKVFWTSIVYALSFIHSVSSIKSESIFFHGSIWKVHIAHRT